MISDELLNYAEEHSSPELNVLARLNRETHLTQLYPRMLAGHLQGIFLRMISRMIHPMRVLEIGTFTGYSTINFAYGLPACGLIHTIEINPELEEMIHRYLAESGLAEKVVLHIGDAMNIVPTINEPWDLIYLDADKYNYPEYYNMLIGRLRPGGFLLADNALWGGKVIGDSKKMDKDTAGIVKFNEIVQSDERVENLLLPFRDGVMMVRKL